MSVFASCHERRLCDAAGLDPMGLLASGALLLAVADEDATKALEAIRSAGVPAERIGTLLQQEDGVIDGGGRHPTETDPPLRQDEAARFLSRSAGFDYLYDLLSWTRR